MLSIQVACSTLRVSTQRQNGPHCAQCVWANLGTDTPQARLGKRSLFFSFYSAILGNEGVTSSTTPASCRQLHELNIQKRQIHLIEIKYCEDTRPGAQLEASKQQHSELCKQFQGAETALHTILLGVGGTIYTAHTLDR
eukprot:1141494-Pelagomonas_calceolata.AAC.1